MCIVLCTLYCDKHVSREGHISYDRSVNSTRVHPNRRTHAFGKDVHVNVTRDYLQCKHESVLGRLINAFVRSIGGYSICTARSMEYVPGFATRKVRLSEPLEEFTDRIVTRDDARLLVHRCDLPVSFAGFVTFK